MTITKELLDSCLVDLYKQHDAAMSALRTVEGATRQVQWLLAKLQEPEPASPADQPSV